MAKSGKVKSGKGGNNKKKVSETEEQRAQRRAQEKLEKELALRRKYQPYLDKMDNIVCRIKYLYGMNEKFNEIIQRIIPPLTQSEKVMRCDFHLRSNFIMTSEYNWIESGVIQRPFDRITESIEIEDEQLISVTSLQGFDAHIRNSEFEDEMSDSREIVQYNGWREKFRELEKQLFRINGNIASIISKIWGTNFNNYSVKWPLEGGYRRLILDVTVGKQKEDGWFKHFRYLPANHYSAFKGTKSNLFGNGLHQAGLYYASHESILPKLQV
jgi:hypothetical protein